MGAVVFVVLMAIGFLILSILFLKGKGSFLISGYNNGLFELSGRNWNHEGGRFTPIYNDIYRSCVSGSWCQYLLYK